MPALGAGAPVWNLRSQHDPSAAAGIPPHVTLMYPFLPPARLTESTIEELASLIRETPEFDFTLTRIREFEQGVVYLEPEPADPFVRLTGDIGRRFGLLPFGGQFGDVPVPHLTVAMPESGATRQQVADQLGSALPMALHADRAWLMVGDTAGGWVNTRTMRLQIVSSRDLRHFFKSGPNRFESDEGFSVEIVGRAAFPAVTIRYKEGTKTIDAWAEAMARGIDFALDPSSIRWNPPHESEPIDDHDRERILQRIQDALEYGGYKSDRY